MGAGPESGAAGAAGPAVEPAAEPRGWRAALAQLWEGIRDSVRIQRRDRPVQALPSARLRRLYHQDLELNLESARLALAGGAERLYRDSLANALESLARHFDADAATTRAMRAELEALAAVDIRPQLPDLGETLRALQAEQALRQSALQLPASTAPDAAPAGSAGGAAEPRTDSPSRAGASPGPAVGEPEPPAPTEEGTGERPEAAESSR